MNRLESNNYQAAMSLSTRKLALVGKSVCIGLMAGAVTSVYRLVLGKAEGFCFALYDYLRQHPALIPGLFLVLAGLGYTVGKLAAKYPFIRGSGIPQVKGEIMGHFEAPWLSTLLAKFAGGAACIVAGLSLGREGPSIQLGASVAQGFSKRWASSRTERRILIAGGASAGLAAAFNAPLAGAMFAVEEIFKYLSPTVLLVTTVSAVVGDFVSKLIFGLSPVFSFQTPQRIPLADYGLLLVMGILLGGAGALYNATLLKAQDLYKRCKKLPSAMRPVIPFLLAGILGLVLPQVLGGGHEMLAYMNGSTYLPLLLLLFTVKFLFSMVSFGSGAPGGIFFPLLILGGTIGAMAGQLAGMLGISSTVLMDDFIIVAMAGYFAAIVRAPITGVILLLEMTGSFVNLLPLIVVSIVAYLTAELLKSKPIYDSLLENLLGGGAISKKKDPNKKIMVELIAHHGCEAAGRTVKELAFPKECLLIAIRREGEELIPSGQTTILEGDSLIFLLNERDEPSHRELLERVTACG